MTQDRPQHSRTHGHKRRSTEVSVVSPPIWKENVLGKVLDFFNECIWEVGGVRLTRWTPFRLPALECEAKGDGFSDKVANN